MKKLMFFLSIIGVSMLMTSCLKGGSRNYSESGFVYITTNSDGLVYGRSSTGRFITSADINMMSPGQFKFFAYSWEESYGSTQVGNYTVDNVQILGEKIDIRKVGLSTTPAPNTPSGSFVAINQPLYAPDAEYFGDHWIFEYAYKPNDGQTPIVNFHKRADAEGNENEISIDIRISGVGTTGTAKADAVALNMAPIRAMYAGSSSTATKELKIKFYYYVEGREGAIEMGPYRMLVAAN